MRRRRELDADFTCVSLFLLSHQQERTFESKKKVIMEKYGIKGALPESLVGAPFYAVGSRRAAAVRPASNLYIRSKKEREREKKITAWVRHT